MNLSLIGLVIICLPGEVNRNDADYSSLPERKAWQNRLRVKCQIGWVDSVTERHGGFFRGAIQFFLSNNKSLAC